MTVTLRYTISAEDFVQFNLYHYDNTPLMRRGVRSLRFTLAGILILLGILLSGGNLNLILFAMLALAVAWLWFFPWYVRRSLLRNVKRQIRLGHYSDFIGEHTLTLTATGIQETAPHGNTEHPWGAVQRFGRDDTRFYLYISQSSAVIVPTAAFADDVQRREFLDQVQCGLAGAKRSSAEGAT